MYFRILTCTQYVVGSNGTIEVQYSLGGRPAIFALSSDIAGSGVCGSGDSDGSDSGSSLTSVSSDGLPRIILSQTTLFSLLVILLGLFTFCV